MQLIRTRIYAQLPKILRFVFIGMLSGLTYAFVVYVSINFFGINPKMASIVGYVSSLPGNFLGNKFFSFRSNNSIGSDLNRYVLVHFLNALASFSIMLLTVDYFKMHYFTGVIFTVFIIPILNFIAMNYWVFRHRSK
jgi:putative flippase GtrA